MGNADSCGALATVTHARLRAAQGDKSTARRILLAVLSCRPDDAEARALLARLDGADTVHAEPMDETSEGPPVPGDPGELARRFHGPEPRPETSRERTLRRLRELEALIQRNRR